VNFVRGLEIPTKETAMKLNAENSAGSSKSIRGDLASSTSTPNRIWKLMKKWKIQLLVSGVVVIFAFLSFLDETLDLPHLLAGAPSTPTNWAEITLDVIAIFLVGSISVIMLSVFESKRKQAEEELIRLSTAVKMSTDSIVISDLEAKVIDINEATLKMYGTDSKEDLIGKKSFDIIAPQDKKRALEGMQKVLKKGYLKDGEYHIVTKNGKQVPLEVSVALMRDGQGRPLGFVAVSRDITERNRAEEVLKRSEEKFRSLFENANDGIIYLDESGRILDVNKKALEIFGGPKREVLGRHYTKLGIFSTRDIPVLTSKFDNILASEKIRLNVCIKSKKGQEVPLECSVSIVRMGDHASGIMVVARDVTERKRTEEALQEERNKLQAIVDSMEYGLTIQDRDYNIIYQNEVLRKFLGDNLGEKCYRAYEFSDKICDGCPVRKAWADGKSHTAERKVVYPSGEILFWENTASPIRDARGEIVACLEITRNITDRKKSDEEIRKLSQYLESIIDNANLWLDVLDENGNVVIWNKAAEQISGYPREEVVGRGEIWEWLFPDQEYRNKITAKVAAIIEKGEVVEDFETTIRCKDGEIKTISWNSRNLLGAEGKPVGSIALGRDVTEKKRTEEALRESEEKFRNLAEQSPNMIFINQKGRIVYANVKCEEIMGYKREEFYSHDFDFLTLISREYRDSIKRNFSRHVMGEDVDPIVYTLVTKENKEIEGILNTKLMRYGGESAILGIVTDITERKRSEERLRETEKLAATGRMAARIAHEINNPLAGIKNSFLLIKDAIPEDHPYYEYVGRIEKETDRIARIVHEMFDLYRQDREPLRQFSIQETIHDVVALLQLSSREHQVDIKLDTSEAPVVDSIPEDSLRQVLFNIIQNAIEASPPGEKVRVAAGTSKDFLTLTISDQGKGIAEEIRSHIFEPFFTTKSTEVTGGLGLGLSVSKSLVEALGGSLNFESKTGEGTKFSIILPMAGLRKENQNG